MRSMPSTNSSMNTLIWMYFSTLALKFISCVHQFLTLIFFSLFSLLLLLFCFSRFEKGFYFFFVVVVSVLISVLMPLGTTFIHATLNRYNWLLLVIVHLFLYSIISSLFISVVLLVFHTISFMIRLFMFMYSSSSPRLFLESLLSSRWVASSLYQS